MLQGLRRHTLHALQDLPRGAHCPPGWGTTGRGDQKPGGMSPPNAGGGKHLGSTQLEELSGWASTRTGQPLESLHTTHTHTQTHTHTHTHTHARTGWPTAWDPGH